MGLYTLRKAIEGNKVISPGVEIPAYESLWLKFPTIKKIWELFNKHDHALPSVVAMKEGISNEEISNIREAVFNLLPPAQYEVLFYNDFEYPQRLRDARYPIEVLYYQGVLDLLSSKIISIVGTRQATTEGTRRAKKLSKFLVCQGYSIMSGLAEGIDTAAHIAAIEAGGNTIGVIGTSLRDRYPKSNKELQELISKKFLLLSQTPFYLTWKSGPSLGRFFFPERNKTMSALSIATIIVEASDTSGSLIQARSALEQGRKVFILNSCFERGLKWPEALEKRGAKKVNEGEEIIRAINGH